MLAPGWGGRVCALLKRISVYFVLELFNCEVHIIRGTVFSSVKHSCLRDQAGVIGEQGHKLLVTLGWALGRTREEARQCLDIVVPYQRKILHEFHWINIDFIYISKGNVSILTILGVMFSQKLLSSQLESLEKNISKKKELENNPVFSF